MPLPSLWEWTKIRGQVNTAGSTLREVRPNKSMALQLIPGVEAVEKPKG